MNLKIFNFILIFLVLLQLIKCENSLLEKKTVKFIQRNKVKKYDYKQPKGARVIKYSNFKQIFKLGHKIKFICIAQGDPIPTINWFKDNIELNSHAFANIYEWFLPDNKIKSKLEIDPARQMDLGTYECQANNKYSIDKKIFKTDF